MSNGYLTHALNALSLRPKLLRDAFAFSDLETGVFSLMFYKNGQHVGVEIDDLVPLTEDGVPCCMMHEDMKS